MTSKRDFIAWEAASRDTLDFKKIYVDITGDLIAGLMLSQIVYWYLPNKNGNVKLRVYKNNEYWLAKNREDWWEEIRITTRQYDRAKIILENKGIIKVTNTMFNNKRTPHILLMWDRLIELTEEQLGITQSVRPVLQKM